MYLSETLHITLEAMEIVPAYEGLGRTVPLTVFDARWKSRSALSQPCVLSPQKYIHSKTGSQAFVLWVEDGEQ